MPSGEVTDESRAIERVDEKLNRSLLSPWHSRKISQQIFLFPTYIFTSMIMTNEI